MTSSNGNIFHVTGQLCGEFTDLRPVTRSFDVFFYLRLNKRFSKQWWGWWIETSSRPLWRHCNDLHNQSQQNAAYPNGWFHIFWDVPQSVEYMGYIPISITHIGTIRISTLRVQVIACCLTATKHHLNQCRFIMGRVPVTFTWGQFYTLKNIAAVNH